MWVACALWCSVEGTKEACTACSCWWSCYALFPDPRAAGLVLYEVSFHDVVANLVHELLVEFVPDVEAFYS